MAVSGSRVGVTGTVTPPVISHAGGCHVLARLLRLRGRCDRVVFAVVIGCRVRSQLSRTVSPSRSAAPCCLPSPPRGPRLGGSWRCPGRWPMRVAGPVRRDKRRSLFVLERGPAFRLARKSNSRTVGRGGHPEGPERSGGAAQRLDGCGRPCAAGRRGSPGAHCPAERAARRRPHRRRVRTGAASRRTSVRGARGKPPASPMSDIGYAGSSHTTDVMSQLPFL